MIKPQILIPERAVAHDSLIVLMCAAYVAGERPKYVCARYAGPYQHDTPPIPLPGFVGVKLGFISAYGAALAWYKLDVNLSRSDGLPGATASGIRRYQRFVAEAIAAGFTIEWQKPPGRYYGDRASLERTLNGALAPYKPAYTDY